MLFIPEWEKPICRVDASFVLPKVMRCLPRYHHDPVVLAQKDVPGVGTKLSINFEPFLVLDQ